MWGCTVLVNGTRINSCLTLAVMKDGCYITTIEGVAQGEALHPLQAAFIRHDAFQCGYCTPRPDLFGSGFNAGRSRPDPGRGPEADERQSLLLRRLQQYLLPPSWK